ncbi:MAG: gp436 family protein [Sphingomonadaceae bacterium]
MTSFTPTIKQPAEVTLRRFELGQPAGVPLQSLVSATATPAGRVVPAVTPLVIDSAIVGQTYVQLRLTGGDAGELYHLSVLVEDEAGHRFEADAEVLVVDLAFRAAGAQTSLYLSIEQFIARTGIDEAIRLTDETGAGFIDARRLDAALLDAEATVNSYLGVRYRVPVALPAPDPLPTLTFDLALANLFRGELPAGVAERRDAAIALLKDLAAGRAALPEATAPAASSPTPVLVSTPERRFDRRRMAGF